MTVTNGSVAAMPVADLATLRATHQVRLIQADEEGKGIAALPNGVYGFTCAPQEVMPLFQKQIFQSFEVHKLPDGEIHIVGFVTEAEAALLAKTAEFVDVKLYPAPYEAAVKPVSIPIRRSLRARGPARDQGNGLKLELRPLGQAQALGATA